MNMMLDFQPLNGHFSDYRNMATKAAYYGRDVINEAGAWLRKCFAAEARVVRANSMYGGAHSMVVSQEERKKVAEAWERLQQDGTATGAAQDGWKWGLCPRSVQPKGRVLSVKGSREG